MHNSKKMVMRAGTVVAMRSLEEELKRLGYVGVPNKVVGPKQYCRREIRKGGSYLNPDDVVVTLSWPQA